MGGVLKPGVYYFEEFGEGNTDVSNWEKPDTCIRRPTLLRPGNR